MTAQPVVNDRHYALVVGINTYPGLTDLGGPVNDAKNFRDWLVDPVGGHLPDDNVRLLLSDDGAVSARPLRDEIDDALLDLNAKAMNDIGASLEDFARSRLIIYVAGHGIMPGNGDGALLLANARKGAYSRNIELRAYADWYARAGLFAQVLVYADCCRNWYPQARGTPPTFDDPGRPNGPVQYLIWYGTGPDEFAYEYTETSIPPDERRGYFTSALLDGLRGGASARRDGTLTAQALLLFVRVQVSKAVARSKKAVPQVVTVVGTLSDAAHDPVLAWLSAPTRAARVTIRFPANFAEPVELELPDDTRLPGDPTAGPWTVEVPVGRYGVVLAGTDDGSSFAGEGLFRADGVDRDVNL